MKVMAAHGATGILLYLDWRRAVLCWVIPYIFGADAIVTMSLDERFIQSWNMLELVLVRE
jgi:hypothetical protein